MPSFEAFASKNCEAPAGLNNGGKQMVERREFMCRRASERRA